MKQAAVKQEPEVIADPRGTAVNEVMRSSSPSSRPDGMHRSGKEHTDPNPLMWSQLTFKEIGDGARTTEVPACPERRLPL